MCSAIIKRQPFFGQKHMSTVKFIHRNFTDLMAARIEACISDLKRELKGTKAKYPLELERDLKCLMVYAQVFEHRQYLEIELDIEDLSSLLINLDGVERKYKN